MSAGVSEPTTTVHAELTAEALAERLKHAIRRSGMTQQAVAEAAQMDPTALSKVLGGKRHVSSLEFALLCKALKGSPLLLLEGFDPPPPPAAASSARVRQLAELDVLLTGVGYPASKDHCYPATLLDRAVEAWLAGHISIRPIAGLIGADPDGLLDQVAPARPHDPPEETATGLFERLPDD